MARYKCIDWLTDISTRCILWHLESTEISSRPGLRPGRRWGSSRRSPDSVVGWEAEILFSIPHPSTLSASSVRRLWCLGRRCLRRHPFPTQPSPLSRAFCVCQQLHIFWAKNAPEHDFALQIYFFWGSRPPTIPTPLPLRFFRAGYGPGLSVCNVCAPFSGDWNFRQCFYTIWYLGHLWPLGKNFTEIVPGEPSVGAGAPAVSG